MDTACYCSLAMGRHFARALVSCGPSRCQPESQHAERCEGSLGCVVCYCWLCGVTQLENRCVFLAGSLPPAWFTHASAWSANLSALDVSYNDLNGSLPADAAPGGGAIPAPAGYNSTAAATVTLDPMNAGYGLCGAVPAGIFAVSAEGGRRPQGTLPSGPCNGTGLPTIPLHQHRTSLLGVAMQAYRQF